MISRLFIVVLILSLSPLSHARLGGGKRGSDKNKGKPISAPSSGFYENSANPVFFELIKSARTSIDIEIYQMTDITVRKLIRDALARGVKFRIVHERSPVGKHCDLFAPTQQGDPDCNDQRLLVSQVRNQGGQFTPFNTAQLCGPGNCLQHGKLVIADQSTALLSTGNFNSSSFCNAAGNPTTCNRDYSYVTNDLRIVGLLKSIFENDLRAKPYDLKALIAASPVSEILTVSPLAEDSLIDFIQSAKNLIQVQNQYLKDPRLNDALMSAARRGVRVEIMVASACSFGRPSPGEASTFQRIYSAFESAGAKVLIFNNSMTIQGRPGYLHSKAMVVDGNRAWLGSINGSTQSLTRNREFGLYFADAKEVNALATIMAADFSDPNTETWQESIDCEKDILSSSYAL